MQSGTVQDKPCSGHKWLSVKALYCEFETEHKEHFYFNAPAADEKKN